MVAETYVAILRVRSEMETSNCVASNFPVDACFLITLSIWSVAGSLTSIQEFNAVTGSEFSRKQS